MYYSVKWLEAKQVCCDVITKRLSSGTVSALERVDVATKIAFYCKNIKLRWKLKWSIWLKRRTRSSVRRKQLNMTARFDYGGWMPRRGQLASLARLANRHRKKDDLSNGIHSKHIVFMWTFYMICWCYIELTSLNLLKFSRTFGRLVCFNYHCSIGNRRRMNHTFINVFFLFVLPFF